MIDCNDYKEKTTETTVQEILKLHNAWNKQLEIDLLRHFEKLRSSLIKRTLELDKEFTPHQWIPSGLEE